MERQIILPGQTQEPGYQSKSPYGVEGAQRPPSTAFPGLGEKAGSEAEQLLMWDVRTTEGNLAHYATMLIPTFFLHK